MDVAVNVMGKKKLMYPLCIAAVICCPPGTGASSAHRADDLVFRVRVHICYAFAANE